MTHRVFRVRAARSDSTRSSSRPRASSSTAIGIVLSMRHPRPLEAVRTHRLGQIVPRSPSNAGGSSAKFTKMRPTKTRACRRRSPQARAIEAFRRMCAAAAQRAIERVGPAVVAAHETRLAARRLVADPRAAVPADVEQRVDAAFGVADDDHGLARDLEQEIVAPLRYLALVADVEPGLQEDAPDLGLVDSPRRDTAPRAARDAAPVSRRISFDVDSTMARRLR